MKKYLIPAVAALLASTLLGWGGSTINPTVPAPNSPMASAPIRNNFIAAYNDVNNVLGQFASQFAPSNPTVNQEWMDTAAVPWVQKIWDGGQWVPQAKLNATTHVWTIDATAGVSSIAGTANQITASAATGAVTLSTPSDFRLPGTVNKLTLTQPATGATLTLADGKTLTVGNSLQLLGTDSTAFTFPSTSGTVATLNVAQTITAAKTFTNSDILLLGSSTGATTLTSDNSGASNFTLHLPAANDTLAAIAATQTLTNKSISGGTNTLSAIANASLTNSAITIGGASTSLGGTVTTTTMLDSICSTQGSVLYRNGAGAWVCLAPGTGGFVLSTGGAGANPSWVTAPSPTASVLQVRLTSNQSVTDLTNTIVKFNNVQIDSQSAYSTVTGLYTPTRAGKYQVCYTLRGGVTTTLALLDSFPTLNAPVGPPATVPNGSARFWAGPLSAASPAESSTVSGCQIYALNGTTDYIAIIGTVSGSGGADIFIGGANLAYSTMTVVYLGS